MKLKSSYICLNGVRFHARHGVMPQETAVGGDFLVSLRLGYDISRAMQSDQVADTLSYADVYDLLKSEMQQPSRLLEHVAGRIAGKLFAAFPDAVSLDLTLTKTNPPMGAECDGAGVELHLINDKTKQ